MFQNDVFEQWLDKKSSEIIVNIENKQLTTEEMMILVLKAQSNHFTHLDQDLRDDMKDLREDMQTMNTDLREEMKFIRLDMDKRFEQVDKRFDRVYTFMRWQTGIGFGLLMTIIVKLFMV